MATQSLINPFADYGGIVFGDRFVGRKLEIQRIEQRVFGSAYGNIAIMGLPRIGKSSLVWQSIMTKKEQLEAEKTLPIYFQTGSCKNSTLFFQQLVSLLDEELSLICDDPRYENNVKKVVDTVIANNNPVEFSNAIQKYFKFVKRLGYKIIYILDEFDSVQKIFEVADFQMLRELSYNPDTKICLVTCSRKTIQEIEAVNGAISNFYGTFSEIRLGMYNDDDLSEYWSRVPAGFTIDENYKSTAKFYTGNHPFLLDVFNDFCLKNGFTSIESELQLEEIRLNLWHQFKTIQDTLVNEDLLDKAIQLVLGPVYDVTGIEEEKLLKYQFIHLVDNEEKIKVLGRLVGPMIGGQSYMCFSDYFTLFFDQEHLQNIDYWPLWSETERHIRKLIKIYISEKYSSDWETEMIAQYGSSESWMTKFNRLKSTREHDKKLFEKASDDLVDYTQTPEMYEVFMNVAWQDWFGKVFEGQKKDWAKKFSYLAAIRNPMAHNNKEFISKEEIQKATDLCNEINRVIGEWEAKAE